MPASLAITNASRLWEGGPPVPSQDASLTSSRPNALLIVNGWIVLVGSTEQILEQRTARLTSTPSMTIPVLDCSALTRRSGCLTSSSVTTTTTVLPGFTDAHIHLLDGGRKLRGIDLRNVESRSEFVSSLSQFLAKRLRADWQLDDEKRRHSDSGTTRCPPPLLSEVWITEGTWWDNDRLVRQEGGQSPTRQWLDEAIEVALDGLLKEALLDVDERREARLLVCVMMARVDLHAVLVSSSVLLKFPELATVSIPGGTVERFPAPLPAVTRSTTSDDAVASSSTSCLFCLPPEFEQLSGVLKEKAIGYVKQRALPASDTLWSLQDSLQRGAAYVLEQGITMVHNMSSLDFSNLSEVNFLAQLEEEHGELPLRIRMAIRTHEVQALQEAVWVEKAKAFAPDASWDLRPFASGRREVAVQSHGEHRSEPSTSPLQSRAVGGYLRLGCVKFFADGSLGSRTAAMKVPFADCPCSLMHPQDPSLPLTAMNDDDAVDGAVAVAPSTTPGGGYMLQPEEALVQGMCDAAAAGLQCCVHAIGDYAVEFVTTTFEQRLPQSHVLRPRIEHCQHVDNRPQTVYDPQEGSRDDNGELTATMTVLSRLSDCGGIASCQPCHMLLDGASAEAALGAARKDDTSYLFATMEKEQVPLAFGSDWPVVSGSVLDGLAAAVGRWVHGQPQPWNAGERITLSSALRHYTWDAAVAGHCEHDSGMLAEGYLGDVTILIGCDLLEHEDEEEEEELASATTQVDVQKLYAHRTCETLRRAQVGVTIVGGVIKYVHPDLMPVV